jgi:hypothetical protein
VTHAGRSQKQLELRLRLACAHPILGRAIALRDALQEVLADGRSAVHPPMAGMDLPLTAPAGTFRKLSRTLKDHSTAFWPASKPV